jgi:TolB-like protein/class 3 adenylate cyclase
MEHRRQLAAILFSDIVGYSAVMQHSEAEAVAMMKRYETVLQKEVLQHGGTVINDYGDGSLCLFSSALEAVEAAIAIQAGLRNKPPVPLRIGLHIGEVVFENGKIMGDGVNIASRIQSLGQANTVLVSSEIYSKIRNHPELNAVLKGTFRFKNIDEPVPVFAMACAGLFVPQKEEMTGKLEPQIPATFMRKVWNVSGIILFLVLMMGLFLWIRAHWVPKSVGIKEQSVAVLYFDNLSGDSLQDYFSAGMTEEIINRLSNIADLRVKSRQSVLRYKGKDDPVKTIARDLGVGSILQGSVRMQENQVLVTVQLVDGSTETTLWSVSYSRDISNIFDVQADIARQVAAKFGIPLSETTRSKLATPPTRNFIAYDLYLKAIADVEMESGIGGKQYFHRAIAGLKEAVALDTSFADAYAKLAMVCSYVAANDRDPQAWFDTALAYARQAVKVGPEREQGYVALAQVQYLLGMREESLRNLMKAEAIRPFSATQIITNQLIEQHAFGEAWEWLEKARRHDPADPVPHAVEIWIFLALGLEDSVQNRVDALLEKGSQPPEMEQPLLVYYLFTGNEQAYATLAGKIYAADKAQYAYNMGKYHLFRRNWAVADSFYRVSSRPDQMDAGLIALHLGNDKQGRDMLQNTIESRLKFMNYYHAWHAYDISRCYAALEDDRFINYFNKALQKGWFDYLWLGYDPFFDSIRQSDSFQKIWKQLTLYRDRYRDELQISMRRMQ